MSEQPDLRVGVGYDVHPFGEGRRLMLGGVEFAHHRGLLGHSDADVLLHAIMDALLGAAGLGDIGQHFPSEDVQFEGVASTLLLARVGGLLHARGWHVVNIDSTVIAERPKILASAGTMRANVAAALEIDATRVGVKATTNERLGFIGREEGIAAMAVALIRRDGLDPEHPAAPRVE
jgi:2-C-methyl-D-erythritol 2,4-cyclodiphosphate synthase